MLSRIVDACVNAADAAWKVSWCRSCVVTREITTLQRMCLRSSWGGATPLCVAEKPEVQLPTTVAEKRGVVASHSSWRGASVNISPTFRSHDQSTSWHFYLMIPYKNVYKCSGSVL